MNQSKVFRRISLIGVPLLVAVICVAVVKTSGQEERNDGDQWEYLAVAGPSTHNFSPTSSSRMRKEPNVPFGREGFVLEQHMDKLGANGWELVSVAGPPTDPVYYFKRRPRAQSSR